MLCTAQQGVETITYISRYNAPARAGSSRVECGKDANRISCGACIVRPGRKREKYYNARQQVRSRNEEGKGQYWFGQEREKEQEKFYIRCPAYKSDGWIN